MKNQYFCKDDDLFLDMLSRTIDGKQTPEDLQQVRAALQAFVALPVKEKKKIQAMKQKIQGFAVSSDFENLVTSAFNVTIAEDNFDMGWEAAFQDVPRDADKNFWEIGDIENGVTFRKVPEGDRIQVDKISGTQQLVYVDYYGGALGFTDMAIRFRKLAQMYMAARAFRNKFYANKADNHYALLAAAAALNVLPWQGGGGLGQIQRDILTINEGAFLMGDANKDKGYGDMANTPLILYANPGDRARIEAAFVVTTNFLATAAIAAGDPAQAITAQPIRRIYTYNSQIVRGFPILVLPGNKIQKNEAMAPTTYTAQDDVLTLNRTQSVWSIYGATVADTDQVGTLTLG